MKTLPMRRYTFTPYRSGPHFILCTWDADKRDSLGKNILRYRLTMCEPGARPVVLFRGEDFACSPLHAIDSVPTADALMAFLTLRPGDTDADYFKSYTQTQLDYCAQHAEALAAHVQARWKDKNGNFKPRYSR